MFSSSFILSPLSQFEVNSLIGFNAPILGFFNLSLTNLGLYTLFTLLVILGVHIYGNNDSKLIPSKWSIAFESSFQSLGTMVRDQIGSLNEIYLPFIYAIF
jgi:F-type H+-transporting ATPase subunit a